MTKARGQYKRKQETETNIQEGIKNRNWTRKYSSSYRKRSLDKKVSSCSSTDTIPYSIGWYPQTPMDFNERVGMTEHKDKHNKREGVPKTQCGQTTRTNSGRVSEQLQRRDGMSGIPQPLKQQQQMRKKRRKKESASHVRLIHKRRRIQQSP